MMQERDICRCILIQFLQYQSQSLQSTALGCAKLLCLTKQRIAWLMCGYQHCHRHRHRPLHLTVGSNGSINSQRGGLAMTSTTFFSDGHVERYQYNSRRRHRATFNTTLTGISKRVGPRQSHLEGCHFSARKNVRHPGKLRPRKRWNLW
jgi:hypothetical protein